MLVRDRRNNASKVNLWPSLDMAAMLVKPNWAMEAADTDGHDLGGGKQRLVDYATDHRVLHTPPPTSSHKEQRRHIQHGADYLRPRQAVLP